MNDPRPSALILAIQQPAQPPELRRILRAQPISIGRHVSNDICIDEPDVAAIHCRVSWNGKQFEVTSAGRDGVDLNGTLVRHSSLKEGDVLRIGTADLVVQDRETQTHGEERFHLPAPTLRSNSVEPKPTPLPLADDRDTDQSSREVPLKPVTEETAANREGWAREVVHNVRPVAGSRRGRDHASATARQLGAPAPSKSVEGDAARSEGHWYGQMDREESEVPVPVLSEGEGRPGGSSGTRLSQRLNETRVRPGEQDALRSPLILGMFGAALTLGLIALAVWFLIKRETAQDEYNAAVSEFDAKHYGTSADLFEKFEKQHGRHRLASDAHYKMWDARVFREIGVSAPSWKRGLESLIELIDANREREDFYEHYPQIAQFATQIAIGSAKSAENSKQRDLLQIYSAAEAMVPRYYPESKIPPDVATRMHDAFEGAQDAIVRHERIAAKIVEIEKANAERHPMAALEARRGALALYPDAAGDPKLAALLNKTLSTEKSLVVREEINKAAITNDFAAAAAPPLTLTLHTRSHTEEAAGTRPVFILAKDCCFAVDHATGEPIWRRVIGLDSPFFPIPVATSVPGVVLFDTNSLSLVLVAARTGKPLWLQPLGELVSGTPLIDQGQLYLATLGHHLYKIDLESGRISTRLTFSQKILSPPALTRNKERLIVAGDASLIYTLNTSPLECMRVNDLGHAAGSLVNGVLEMGSLALVTETGRPSGTRLHVLDAKNEETWLKTIKVETVAGQVRDAPVIYGKMLFVASVPARITAFSISDAPGQESLTQTASMTIPKQEDAPIFLSAGPDGQLWMAGSSVRRLQLKLNSQSFALDPSEIAAGISTQPLQVIGPYLFAGRRLSYATSIFFSQIDREPMLGQWRTVLGSSVIAASAGAADMICVGEAGEVFSLGMSDLETRRFKLSAVMKIEPPSGTKTPLRATKLDDGQIVVDCGGPKPTLWVIATSGQATAQFPLEKPLEARPVRLASGLVLPMPGRLRLVSSSGGSAGEDVLAPLVGDKASPWLSAHRLNDSDLVAIDRRGRLTRFQFRSDPVRHLVAVVSKTIDPPLDLELIIAGDRIAYARADGEFQVLDSVTLDTVFSEKLPSPAVNELWVTGTRVLVETRNHDLLSYETSGQAKRQFCVPLENSGPAGAPAIVQGRLLVANRDGTVVSLDPSRGRLLSKLAMGQPLTSGVIPLEGHVLVAAIDGSLYRVDSLLESKTKP